MYAISKEPLKEWLKHLIPPGGKFDYSFITPDAGTYWYHSHTKTWEQVARGLYGLLIVDEEIKPLVDRDIIFAADDWVAKKPHRGNCLQ